jgi:hypothetical protein
MAGHKPDYSVLANRDATDPGSRLIEIGVAWNCITKSNGTPYISVLLYARPWGSWDGKLQLHPRKVT